MHAESVLKGCEEGALCLLRKALAWIPAWAFAVWEVAFVLLPTNCYRAEGGMIMSDEMNKYQLRALPLPLFVTVSPRSGFGAEPVRSVCGLAL